MKSYEFIKIDTVFICEIVEKRVLEFVPNFNRIYEIVKTNMVDDITILFHIGSDGINKIIKHTLTPIEKQLIIEEEVNNFFIFDFLFFGYILEEEDKRKLFKASSIDELKKSFVSFKERLTKHRKDTVIHKTFHVKQRRISRKQLESMQMDFKKWDNETQMEEVKDEE